MTDSIIAFAGTFLGVLIGWALGYCMAKSGGDVSYWKQHAAKWEDIANGWKRLYEQYKQ